MSTPLQRERERRGLTQEQVADRLRQLDPEVGIDANAVSRHERGVVQFPRAPYPKLYARLYATTVDALWPPGTIEAMRRRTFLQALAATPVVTMLPDADASTEAVTAVTGGFRRLEATTPASELRAPVNAHLRFVAHRLSGGGKQLAAAASEAAGFAAWLAVDQDDDKQAAKLYGRAVEYGQRSGSDLLVSYMEGSRLLWLAETEARPVFGSALTAGFRDATELPPTVRAWLAVVEATAHAAHGNADDTFAALQRAEHAIASNHEPSWPWLFPFDARRLAGYVGACATKLNLHKTAIPALQDALPQTRTKQRALILVDLSTNYAALGQHDQARVYAHEAASIGQERHSMKILRRLQAA
jgi:transcriptional regulator with XRE-family HTH domain